jgi:pimeloyl-ACP methyl ester carboxylesterase
MVRSEVVSTSRLAVHCLIAGPEDAPVVVLVHGNVSSGAFFGRIIEALAPRYRVIAPDLRGYGATEAAPIDATRGLRDFSDDLTRCSRRCDVDRPVHLVGWSVGGGVCCNSRSIIRGRSPAWCSRRRCRRTGSAARATCRARRATPTSRARAPARPTPSSCACWPRATAAADAQVSPRNVMRGCYFRPPNRVDAAREEAYLTAMLTTRVGDDHYPGDPHDVDELAGRGPGDARHEQRAVAEVRRSLGLRRHRSEAADAVDPRGRRRHRQRHLAVRLRPPRQARRGARLAR